MAGLYAMERSWEKAAWMSVQSMRIEFTEEAFCAMMKAFDNICLWQHPLRDDKLLSNLLFEKAKAALLAPERSTKDKLCFNAVLVCDIFLFCFPLVLVRLHDAASALKELVLLIARAEMAIEHKSIVPIPSELHRWKRRRRAGEGKEEGGQGGGREEGKQGERGGRPEQRVEATHGIGGILPDPSFSLQLLRGKRLVVSYVSGHFANHPMMQVRLSSCDQMEMSASNRLQVQMMQSMFLGHSREKLDVSELPPASQVLCDHEVRWKVIADWKLLRCDRLRASREGMEETGNQSRAGENRAGQGRAGRGRAGQGRAGERRGKE
eukprot:757828-Hanusia_phi.AAC.3